jgi:hypothetical protein
MTPGCPDMSRAGETRWAGLVGGEILPTHVYQGGVSEGVDYVRV